MGFRPIFALIMFFFFLHSCSFGGQITAGNDSMTSQESAPSSQSDVAQITSPTIAEDHPLNTDSEVFDAIDAAVNALN